METRTLYIQLVEITAFLSLGRGNLKWASNKKSSSELWLLHRWRRRRPKKEDSFLRSKRERKKNDLQILTGSREVEEGSTHALVASVRSATAIIAVVMHSLASKLSLYVAANEIQSE